MLTGKGLTILHAEQVIARMGLDVAAVAQVARDNGISHAIIKIADGGDPFPNPIIDSEGIREGATRELIAALKDAGIPVWGFAPVYGVGKNIGQQANRLAERTRQFALPGLVIRAAGTWKFRAAANRTRMFTTILRQELGSEMILALSSYRYPRLHNLFPFDAFLQACDLVMPQVFWPDFGGREGDAAHNLRKSFNQYKRLFPDKPYTPVAAAFGESQPDGSFWSATPNQVTRFLEQAQQLRLPAINFWSWEQALNDPENERTEGTELWGVIAGFDYETGAEMPASPNNTITLSIGEDGYFDGVYPQFPNAGIYTFTHENEKYKYAASVRPTASVWAAWTPKLQNAGKYEIAVWIPGKHASAKVSYHIHGVTGGAEVITVKLDQSQFFDDWVTLGSFQLDDTDLVSGVVQLDNLSVESGLEVAFASIRWRLLQTAKEMPLADGFDAPVGTVAERQSSRLWPGGWYDFTGYDSLYTLRREKAGTAEYQDIKAYHTGVDLNLPQNRDRLMPLYAAASGEVTYAENRSGWGRIVIIRHDPLRPGGEQMYSRYGHMIRLDVAAGERVERGQQIGLIGEGDPNRPFASHLHFDISPTDILLKNPAHWPGLEREELRRHYVDPLLFVSRNRPQE